MADRYPCELLTGYIRHEIRGVVDEALEVTGFESEPGTGADAIHIVDGDATLHVFERELEPLIHVLQGFGVPWVITADAKYEFPGEWKSKDSRGNEIGGFFMQEVGPVVRYEDAMHDDLGHQPPPGIEGFSTGHRKSMRTELEEVRDMLANEDMPPGVQAKFRLMEELLINALEAMD